MRPPTWYCCRHIRCNLDDLPDPAPSAPQLFIPNSTPTGAPTILPSAKRLSRKLDDLKAWDARRQQKREVRGHGPQVQRATTGKLA